MSSVGFRILLGQLLSIPRSWIRTAMATWGLNSPEASSKLACKLRGCPQTVGCKAKGLLFRGEGSEGTRTSSPKSPALLGQA